MTVRTCSSPDAFEQAPERRLRTSANPPRRPSDLMALPVA